MKITNTCTAEYREHMGTDLSVVNAARTSFGKESAWVCSDTGTEYEGMVRQSNLFNDRIPYPRAHLKQGDARHSIVIVIFVFFMSLLLHPQFVFPADNRHRVEVEVRHRAGHRLGNLLRCRVGREGVADGLHVDGGLPFAVSVQKL